MEMVDLIGGLIASTMGMVLSLGGYVLLAWTRSMYLKNRGYESWVGWVPLYGDVKFLETVGKSWVWVLLLFIPPVSIVAAIVYIAAFGTAAKQQGKSSFPFILLAFFNLQFVAFLLLRENPDGRGGPRVARHYEEEEYYEDNSEISDEEWIYDD